MSTFKSKYARSSKETLLTALNWPLKQILINRVVKLSDFTDSGWGPICDQLGVAYPNLTYEFYQGVIEMRDSPSLYGG